MIENVVSKRYAEALLDSITDTERLNPALDNIKSFCRAFDLDKRLSRFFAHPSIDVDKKINMVSELCDRFQVEEVVRNLIKMLTRRKKILLLKNIAGFFEEGVDRRLNQVRAHVLSASQLTDKNIDHLKTSLSRVLGQTVLIDHQVDESLIGGIQLRIGDQVADASIKNKLFLLKRKLEQEEVA